MRQSTGYLDGQECQLLEISMPKAGVPWKQEMQKAVAASEEGVCSRNGTMVIHGRTLGEHPELGAAITCALAKTGTGVYVGEATGLGSGVARCVHPGTGEQHTVGERHWYGHSKSSEAVRSSQTGALLWGSVRPGTTAEHEHQVLVSSRQSVIDRVLDSLEERIGKAQAGGARIRATLVHGPDATHQNLAGFWTRVLEALGARNRETNGPVLPFRREPEPTGAETECLTGRHESAEELEKRAINADQRYWRAGPVHGETLLVVNNFDTWYRQCTEANEEWALQRHLQTKGWFVILGCASEWPASEGTENHGRSQVRVRRVE